MVPWAVAQGHALYTEVWFDQPPGMGLGLAAVFRLWGASLAAARLPILALSLLGVIGVALIARRLGGRAAGLGAALALLLAPHFFWLVRSINPDTPSMALGVLALAALWRYRDGGSQALVPLAGLLLGLGISIKLNPLLLLAPAFVLLATRAWRARASAERGAAWLTRLVADGVLFLLPILALVASWALVAPPRAVAAGVFGSLSRARAAFPDRSGEYALWLLRDNLLGENLALVALGLLGLAWLARRPERRADAAALALWLAATGHALITQRPMWPKHHWSLLLWPLAILSGLGLGALLELGWEALRRRRAGGSVDAEGMPTGRSRVSRSRAWTLAALAALAVALYALPATAARLAETASPRQFSAIVAGAAWVRENVPPDRAIVSDAGQVAFLAGRAMPPSMVTISSKRIRIGDLDDATIIRAAEDPRSAAVLLWNDHLTDFKAFLDWLPTHYVFETMVGEDRAIWRRFEPDRIEHPQNARLDDLAELEGYDLSSTQVRAGETLTATLYWRARGPAPAERRTFVHLVDAAGQTRAQGDGEPGTGRQPAPSWRAGEIIVDPRPIALPPDLAPGDYRLRTGLYDPATGARIPAFKPEGERWSEDAVVLDTALRVLP